MVDKLDVTIGRTSETPETYAAAVHGRHTPPLTYTWVLGEGATSQTSSDETFTVNGSVADQTKLVVTVKDSSDPPVVGDAELVLGASTVAHESQPHQGPMVWSTKLVWGAACFLSGLYLVVLGLLWLGLNEQLTVRQGAPSFTAAIAAGLIASAILALIGGVFLGLLEFRGKATAIDALPGTPKAASTGGEFGDSILGTVDLSNVLEQFRQMSNQIAVLTIAALCVIGAIVITVEAERSARTPTPNSTVTPTATPTR